jgi:hypothetical protein
VGSGRRAFGGGLQGRRGMSLLIGWRDVFLFIELVDRAEMVLASAA